MATKRKGRRGHERAAAGELHHALGAAFDENRRAKKSKTALAFAALAEVVPKVANHTPGWSAGGMDRPFFHKGKR